MQAKPTISNRNNHLKKTSKISDRRINISKPLKTNKSQSSGNDKKAIIQPKQSLRLWGKNNVAVDDNLLYTRKYGEVPIISSTTPSNLHLSYTEQIKPSDSFKKEKHAVKIPFYKMKSSASCRAFTLDVKMNSKSDKMEFDADFENVLSSLLVADFTDESSFYAEYKDILNSFLAK